MSKKLEYILIVDDEVDICFLLKNILKRKTKAQIDICHSVTAAKDMLLQKRYELVFFDMRLNDGTGDELIEFVAVEEIEKPYIAVISAYSSEIDMERLRLLQINEFIAKPLSSEKIINCFEAARA